MSPEERQKKARNSFEHWFKKGNDFRKYADLAIQNADNNIAVFNLHQATETYYAAILLVFTDYKPRTHDIEELGKQVEKLHPEFSTVFPKKTAEEARLFKLLKKAYIDARYEIDYSIEKRRIGIFIRSGETAERFDGADLQGTDRPIYGRIIRKQAKY